MEPSKHICDEIDELFDEVVGAMSQYFQPVTKENRIKQYYSTERDVDRKYIRPLKNLSVANLGVLFAGVTNIQYQILKNRKELTSLVNAPNTFSDYMKKTTFLVRTLKNMNDLKYYDLVSEER